MSRSLSADQISQLRLHSQQLTPDPEPDATVAEVVNRVAGVQTQDARSAALSVRARCLGITAKDVERALTRTRQVVRSWLMRGTLHLAAADEVGWLLSVLGPRFKKTTRRRREQLGLDDETAARGARVLEEVLRHRGPLTRDEIRTAPDFDDVPLEGQAAPHLLGYAALDGRVCHGPKRSGAPTYVPLSEWLDLADAPPAHKARARLAHHYLRAFGPARPRDMARWSGLTLTQSRKGFEQIECELLEITGGEEPLWMLEEEHRQLDKSPRPSTARLLPKYDTLLTGYRIRDWILPEPHVDRIYPGGGLLRRSVLAGGRIVGTWDPERKCEETLRVGVDLFEETPTSTRDALAPEAEDVGHFFGREGSLEIT